MNQARAHNTRTEKAGLNASLRRRPPQRSAPKTVRLHVLAGVRGAPHLEGTMIIPGILLMRAVPLFLWEG
jgi:hypothetical protein